MKTTCQWCHSITLDDARGHCAGCGAPRSEAKRHIAFAVESSFGKFTESAYRTANAIDRLNDAFVQGSIELSGYVAVLNGIPMEIKCSLQAQED